MTKFFTHFTLFLPILIAYFLVINSTSLQNELFNITFQNGGILTLNISEAFIIVGVIAIFIETIKSAKVSVGTVWESALSILVSIVFLILFLLYSSATNSTFLILTIMSFTESITGFVIAVSVARRDFSVNQG